MLHFQRNYPHSTAASIPVSYPLSPSIECTQCAAILVACIPPFSRFFFPSCFWLLLFSSLFLFSSSSFALLPQTSPSPTGTRRIRRLQPIRKLYPLLRRISMITEVSLELDRTRRLVAFVSARIILHDRFFLTGLSVFGLGRDSDRSV